MGDNDDDDGPSDGWVGKHPVGINLRSEALSEFYDDDGGGWRKRLFAVAGG